MNPIVYTVLVAYAGWWVYLGYTTAAGFWSKDRATAYAAIVFTMPAGLALAAELVRALR